MNTSVKLLNLFFIFLAITSEASSLNLSSAMDLFLKNSVQIKKLDADVQITKLKEKNAINEFLPSLDLTAEYGYKDSSNSTEANTIFIEAKFNSVFV